MRVSFSATLAILAFLIPVAARAANPPPVFSTTSEDGSSWISFHLAAQLRWRYSLLEENPDANRITDNQILFRRIRPVLKGYLLGEDLTWLVHLNLVPGYLELMDLWMDYRLSDALRIRAGQTKIPFTRYRLGSFKDRPVVDWSYPTRYFGAERQMGVTIHNGIRRPPMYEYQLGLYTGVNSRASNGIGLSTVFAEPLQSPSRLVDPLPFENLHSEVVVHLAYNSDDIDLGRPTDWQGGSPRFSVGLSGAWDLRPADRQDLRLRIAPEAEFRAYGWAIGGVFYLGWWDQVTGDDSYSLGLVGGVLQTSYLFWEKYEIGLRYTVIEILEDLRRDALRYADDQMTAAPEFADRYQEVGLLTREHEFNLGFNLYILGTTFKWQVDAGLLVHERSVGNLVDFQARTQLQLSF